MTRKFKLNINRRIVMGKRVKLYRRIVKYIDIPSGDERPSIAVKVLLKDTSSLFVLRGKEKFLIKVPSTSENYLKSPAFYNDLEQRANSACVGVGKTGRGLRFDLQGDNRGATERSKRRGHDLEHNQQEQKNNTGTTKSIDGTGRGPGFNPR